MTDSKRPTERATHADEPLFQGQEEQERIYSPQQVLGTDIPPVERDAGNTAAEGMAVATDDDPDNDS